MNNLTIILKTAWVRLLCSSNDARPPAPAPAPDFWPARERERERERAAPPLQRSHTQTASHAGMTRRHAHRLWRGLAQIMPSVLLLLLSALLSGCGLHSDYWSSGSTGDPGDGPALLPQPSVRRVPPPPMTAEQHQRQDAVDQALAKEYQALGWTVAIAETIQTYSNTIVDCIAASAVPGSDAEPPPSAPDELLPNGVGYSQTEVDQHPELECPAGTIAIARPSYDAYVSGMSGATSLQDYLDNHVVAGAPPDKIPGRLYAGLTTVDEIEAAGVWVAAYDGELLQNNTMSVLEMAVGCDNGAGGEEFVGILLSRDRANHDTDFNKQGDALTLHVEYYVDDPAAPDKFRGGPAGLENDGHFFKRIPGWRAYYSGIKITPSEIGDTPLESYLLIQLAGGKWWLRYNQTWLGYYDASLFKHMTNAACWVKWYGEVYYDDITHGWTYTDMGSGLYGEAGLGNAAYFRDPFYTNPGGSHWPDNSLYSKPYSPSCYSRTPLTTGTPPWDRSFFVGGPGTDGFGCK